MIFNEPGYYLFIAVVAVAFRMMGPSSRPWLLTATGVAFYHYFSPSFSVILAVEAILVWGCARLARRPDRIGRAGLAVGLAVTLGALFFYKYWALAASTLSATGATRIPTFTDLALPLAISFFTFEFVHYLVDARRGKLPEHGIGDFLGFAYFVPTMIAGPIKRFQAFGSQARDARATARDVSDGVSRILVGLLKKMVFADTLTLWVAPLESLDMISMSTRTELVVALLAFSFRIYLDFSGYTDIAVGSARLLGIRVPENFDRPYLSQNIAVFWRRWHMSLMTWIRDYIFIPLGGSRQGDARRALSILTAFAVSGLWHGAAWNFVAWGLYHGALVAGYTVLWTPFRQRIASLVPSRLTSSRTLRWGSRVAATTLTFGVVTLGWGLFALPISDFAALLRALVTGGL